MTKIQGLLTSKFKCKITVDYHFLCIPSNICLSRSLFTLCLSKDIERSLFTTTTPYTAASTSNHFLNFLYDITFNLCFLFSPLASTEEQKKRRFNHADEDKDGQLSQDEIISMFHPEERTHMYDVVIDVRFSSVFFAFNLVINSVILFVFTFLCEPCHLVRKSLQ